MVFGLLGYLGLSWVIGVTKIINLTSAREFACIDEENYKFDPYMTLGGHRNPTYNTISERRISRSFRIRSQK